MVGSDVASSAAADSAFSAWHRPPDRRTGPKLRCRRDAHQSSTWALLELKVTCRHAGARSAAELAKKLQRMLRREAERRRLVNHAGAPRRLDRRKEPRPSSPRSRMPPAPGLKTGASGAFAGKIRKPAPMACASAAGSPGGTRAEASGPNISGTPPTLVATSGTPAAAASSTI